MAVLSNFLGSVKVTGDEARALTRKLTHGRASRAAVDAAQNGHKLVTAFAKKGSVAIKLKATRSLSKDSA